MEYTLHSIRFFSQEILKVLFLLATPSLLKVPLTVTTASLIGTGAFSALSKKNLLAKIMSSFELGDSTTYCRSRIIETAMKPKHQTVAAMPGRFSIWVQPASNRETTLGDAKYPGKRSPTGELHSAH
jgi:hypothetical protein